MKLSLRKSQRITDFLSSKLFDQNSFYDTFMCDLAKARHEVVIESPFLTYKRLNFFLPTFRKLVHHNVRIVINTKPPGECEAGLSLQAEQRIEALLELNVQVIVTGGHHRKLAIIDRNLLYEGSLNILSRHDSCEVMRRIESKPIAMEMINFIGIREYIS